MPEIERARELFERTSASESQEFIRVLVFESTKMGAELLARMLESSSYPLSVTAMCDEGKKDSRSAVPEADVAVITATAEDFTARTNLVRQLRQENTALRCIVLLDQGDREQVVEAFSSGATGVCSREESCEVLCKCIDRVFRGQVWANSEQLHYVLEGLSNGTRLRLSDARGHVLLTRRQEEIVFLVVQGLRNREIAKLLNISEHTIRNYLFRIFEKLGISSRAELILYALARSKK